MPCIYEYIIIFGPLLRIVNLWSRSNYTYNVHALFVTYEIKIILHPFIGSRLNVNCNNVNINVLKTVIEIAALVKISPERIFFYNCRVLEEKFSIPKC